MAATLELSIPESILESHHYNLESVRQEAQQGLVILEYLNGHLSLQECGELLRLGYRGFLELLWGKGIALDGLDEEELQQQISQVKRLLKRS